MLVLTWNIPPAWWAVFVPVPVRCLEMKVPGVEGRRIVSEELTCDLFSKWLGRKTLKAVI